MSPRRSFWEQLNDDGQKIAANPKCETIGERLQHNSRKD
jgi:hypothetical protein